MLFWVILTEYPTIYKDGYVPKIVTLVVLALWSKALWTSGGSIIVYHISYLLHNSVLFQIEVGRWHFVVLAMERD